MTAHDLGELTVLVTGAGSGIGRETARALAGRGTRLVLSDVDAAALDRAAAELGAAVLTAVVADLRDAVAIERLAESAFDGGRQLTGLVNCAGIYPVSPLLELSVEEWDAVLGLNLRAPFLLTRAVARRMIAAGPSGSVVNVSSTASTLARPGIAHYGASKAGLNQLTRVLAVELAPHEIRVNAVLPGVIATERVVQAAQTPEARDESAAKLARIPLRRLGEPREVADMILFLLSPASRYCTGGLYPVDGGFTLGIPSYR